ncbi:GNAT family N-acetyltransferase [Clostridium algidicarnis]|uniref:GNAT family N-acetyltransferase n=1 Tax=Clostridium algidicarnis TaxID=37659 RepID=UPI001C0C2140|nr:GNAT family protein [Clostridium algidicarnis]MBU3197222.1 GNAT family N-acetyltransferase [Clostridium algidicarnis]MBU3210527.1 GNAT family N-acetyltransferase [Clostridium algidicarnis]MBU3228192.1 GNAT family N-acetyltransferase [Clostridium algidicarnis]MBU3252076.1 GNAT family N-acetyltransferase [Clostridium algidicarnis]
MREAVYDNYFWQSDLVRLRAWSEEDWEWDYYTNFDTSAARLADYEINLPPTGLNSKKYSERIANLAINNCRIAFAIETLEGIHVGRINILLDDDENGTFGMGLKISSEHRGKGYGTSAMKILLKYGFMEKRLNKYSVSVIEGNEGSIKMHKKLGCEQEGVLKQNIYTNGRYYDEIYFGLTKEDYLKIMV